MSTTVSRRSSCAEKTSACEVTPCGAPSLGITLLFATLGFGADRFYVGQTNLGIALLICFLTVFGLMLAVPITLLSQLSLVMAILTGSRRAFMYGSCVTFAAPTGFDRVLAVLWLVLWALIITGAVLIIVFTEREARRILPPPVVAAP